MRLLKIGESFAPELDISIISLDRPPLALDKTIEGLKRIEIRMPAYMSARKEAKLTVRLSRME